MQKKEFKMKHLMNLLSELGFSSVKQLLDYIASIWIFENKSFDELTESEKLQYPNAKEGEVLSICTSVNDAKAYEFVIGYKVSVLGIDKEVAENESIDFKTLYELVGAYSKDIYEFNALNISASDPNEPATN